MTPAGHSFIKAINSFSIGLPAGHIAPLDATPDKFFVVTPRAIAEFYFEGPIFIDASTQALTDEV